MKTLLLSLALILVVPVSHADLAPTTVAGLRLIGVISSGSGVAFASYGGFAITLASTTYTVTPLSSNVINQTGTYTYTKTGPNSATLHQVDGATGVAGTTNVTFNSATEANYSSSIPAYSSYQYGTLALEGVTTRLINISTRGSAGAGASSLIAGFVVTGTNSKTVLVRGVGPALAQFGVSGILPDPLLTVYNGSTVLATNAGWGTSGSNPLVYAAFGTTGAFSLPNGSTDAALVLTLPPGTYTAQVSSVSGDAGNALVEVYEVSQ